MYVRRRWARQVEGERVRRVGMRRATGVGVVGVVALGTAGRTGHHGRRMDGEGHRVVHGMRGVWVEAAVCLIGRRGRDARARFSREAGEEVVLGRHLRRAALELRRHGLLQVGRWLLELLKLLLLLLRLKVDLKLGLMLQLRRKLLLELLLLILRQQLQLGLGYVGRVGH